MLNDYCPVALTSVLMRSFKCIVKKFLLSMTQSVIDPLQFACLPRKGVEDAVATLLNLVVRHLEGRITLVCLCFADFSSAFNWKQPHVLAFTNTQHWFWNHMLVSWFPDNQARGLALMKLCLRCCCAPQACVFSPLLFMLYTNDCKSMFESRFIIKLANDSVIVSLPQDHKLGHGPVLDYFLGLWWLLLAA